MNELTPEAQKAIDQAVNTKLRRYAGFFGLVNVLVILAAIVSFLTAFDDKWKDSVDSHVKDELGDNLEAYTNLISSNAENVQEQINDERSRLGNTKAQITNLETVVVETTENAQALKDQLSSSDNTELKQLFRLIKDGNSDSFFAVKEDINKLQASVSKTITQCRICINTNSGGQCYPRNQKSCSEWSSLATNEVEWSSWFKDDTDDSGGSCSYKWGIQCK